MNFIVSFWGLLVERVDFWEAWRGLVPHETVEKVAYLVNQINSAGYEVPLRVLVRIFARETGADTSALGSKYVERVKTLMKPRRCVGEFITQLKKRGKVAVLSNTPCRCFVKEFLTEAGLEVDMVLTSDILLRRKPLKSVFKYALAKLGSRPYEAVYFGDGEEDLGALAVGLFTVTIGFEGGHLSFPSLCDASEWVDRHFPQK